jgi:hypothetical protein
MTMDEFCQQIEAVNQRVERLSQCAHLEVGHQPEVLESALEELYSSLEELRVVQSQIHQQNLSQLGLSWDF